MGETHIHIYTSIGSNGITADYIRKKLDKSEDTVIVHINSPGGEVYEGYTIYNILKSSGKKITVVIEGLCASIATLIALSGDKIVMRPTAEFMIHNPMVGIEGDAEDLRKVADQLDNIKKTIIEAYKRKTNKTEEELWQMMDRETFMSASQALEYGFVDEVEQSLKIVAYCDINKFKHQKTMDQKIIEALNSLEAKISGLFKNKPKNLSMTLESGEEVFVETEDETIEGKAIFMVTPEGNVPLEDGDYVLADGRSIKVVGGLIESVVEMDSELENLKAENERLTAELAAKNQEFENLTAQVKSQQETITEIKNQFDSIKKMAVGAKPVGKSPINAKPAESHPFDAIVNKLKNK